VENERGSLGRSSYRGVSWQAKCKKFEVRLKHEGKMQYIGVFQDEQAAAEAWDLHAVRLRGGSFPNLNFPERAQSYLATIEKEREKGATTLPAASSGAAASAQLSTAAATAAVRLQSPSVASSSPSVGGASRLRNRAGKPLGASVAAEPLTRVADDAEADGEAAEEASSRAGKRKAPLSTTSFSSSTSRRRQRDAMSASAASAASDEAHALDAMSLASPPKRARLAPPASSIATHGTVASGTLEVNSIHRADNPVRSTLVMMRPAPLMSLQPSGARATRQTASASLFASSSSSSASGGLEHNPSTIEIASTINLSALMSQGSSSGSSGMHSGGWAAPDASVQRSGIHPLADSLEGGTTGFNMDDTYSTAPNLSILNPHVQLQPMSLSFAPFASFGFTATTAAAAAAGIATGGVVPHDPIEAAWSSSAGEICGDSGLFEGSSSSSAVSNGLFLSGLAEFSTVPAPVSVSAAQ
jgi:hypothetical protein